MLNLSKKTIKSRIYNGWSKHKAETTPLMRSRYIKDKCKEYNINYCTVLTRMISQNMSLEEALTKPTVKSMWNGKPLSEQISKVEYQRVRRRLDFGWTLEEAINTPSLGRGGRKYIYERNETC